MKQTILLSTSCAILISVTAFASDEKPASDGKAVLAKSVQAIKDAKVISYTIQSKPEGYLEEFVPQSDGKIVVGKPAAHDVPRFFADVTLIKKIKAEEGKEATSETVSYKAGSDGNEYYVIDAKTKKAHHDLDVVVLGKDAQNIQRLILREFTDKEPYKTELEAENVTLDGTETVDGVECDKIVVDFGKGRPFKTIWYISRTDHLPRRVQRFYTGREPGQGESTTFTTLTAVKVNPKADKDPFAMVVPEGYTKTDEFAP